MGRSTRHKRYFNLRRIPRHRSYTFEEASDLLGVHKNTVHHWHKDGLVVMNDQKPYLIYGQELIFFLEKRQQARKQKCQADEIFCCKCQKPQKPYEGIVDIRFLNAKKLQLTGLCSVCDAKINQMGAVTKLAAYRQNFTIQQIQDEHLIEPSYRSAICDL